MYLAVLFNTYVCFLNSCELTFGIFFVANQYKKDKHCRFKMSKISNAPSHSFFHLPIKKGSPYAKIIRKG